ncbi:hypothetical protein BVX97_05385 [bacterium E08(2017)]|nr:hypothetical protein BVX97_05385 [bacterium E08(2017)]
MDICVLASGSSGNCVYLGAGDTRILVDAGLSCKETIRRLSEIDVSIDDISAVCVTHEHSDHKEALGVLSRRHGVDVYANSGTVEAIEADSRMHGISWRVFTTGHEFSIGDVCVEPFSVPHDSYEPVGYVFKKDACRVGVVTDMGMATTLIRERLKKCNAVVVESNHDEEMLKNSTRPWSLKQRISGRQGHLSNSQAGDLISDIYWSGLKVVFLAHLSDECNEPEVAINTVSGKLNENNISGVDVKMTYRSRLSDLVSV